MEKGTFSNGGDEFDADGAEYGLRRSNRQERDPALLASGPR